MASRVNVKFVIILSTVLILLAAGTGALAWKVVFKTPDQLAAAADQKMAEQDYKAAEVLYSKAVNKDPYNSEYLLKWREALSNWTPETDRELQTEFNNTYLSIHNQLALSDNRQNIDYQIEYVDLLWDLARLAGADRGRLEMIISACNDNIRVHESARPDDESWIGLRRYRGLARSRIILAGSDLPEQDLEQAKADLRAALDANPADFEVLEAMVAIKRDEASDAQRLGRRTESTQLDAESLQLIDAFLAEVGERSIPGVLASMLRTEIEFREKAAALVRELGAGATPRIEQLTSEYRARVDEFARLMAQAPPEQLTRDVVRRLYMLESLLDIERRYEASLPVLRAAAEAHPDDPLLVLTVAEALQQRGDYDEAFAALESINERPRLPLGMDSVVLIQAKTAALISQVQSAVLAHGRADDDAVKAEWLAKAKGARERLSAIAPDSSPAIQLLDAKIAIAGGDYAAAQGILTEYHNATNNSDREALWLSARVAQQLDQIGNVRAALERLLELDSTMAAAHVALAEVEYRLGRLESAKGHLMQAQRANPEDPDIRRQLEDIDQRLGLAESDDPVKAAVYEARRIAGGTETQIADVASAVAFLADAIARLGPNVELFAEKSRLELINGSPEAAGETVAQGLEAFPDDPTLLERRRSVEASQSVDSLVALIRDSDASDVQKEISIYAALLREGRTEDANAALDRAASIAPDDPSVLELLFNRAMQAGDVAEARRIADRARSTNADRIEGLSFRARLLLMEGKEQDALAALREGVSRLPNNVSLLRLLGRTQVQLGRTADGITNLERALSIKPDDLRTVMELCQVLVNADRQSEALEVARRSETVGRADAQFMELLLTLEGLVGDKPAARDRREKLLAARPGDLRNRLALIDLYIDLGQWQKAAELIESSRSNPDAADALVVREARWHAEQNDLEKSRQVFARHIANTPPDQRTDRYLAMAQFMLQRGRSSACLAALRQAAAYEPEGEHRVDQVLAGTLMRYARFTEANDVFDRILAEDPDAPLTVRLQACEALIAVGRLDEAERRLAAIPGGENDVTVTLLRGQVMLQREKDREARALLDAAVGRWPEDHRVWLLRAEAEAREPDLIPDALADLGRAIELNPGLAEAHRRRAELLVRLGRENEAIEAWRNAVEVNPGNEELRSSLLVTLIQRGERTQAVQTAQGWFDQRPRDVQLRARVAEIFILGGMRDAATDIYLGAFAIERRPEIVLRLADLLLGANPPRLTEAERVFTEARPIVIADPALLLARARVFAQTGRAEAARNDVIASFGLLADRSAEQMAFWFSTMQVVFDDPRETLALVRRVGEQPGAADWSRLFTARLLMDDKATQSEGLAQLRSVVEATRDPKVKYSGLRALAGAVYAEGDHREAIDLWKQALQLRPRDWQVENNIAYALAAGLDQPEEALPFAEAAVQHANKEAEPLDTLGAVYLKLGRNAEAVSALRTAVSLVRGTSDDARHLIRLADALAQSGQEEEARSLLTEVEALLDRGRKLTEEYETLRQDLLSRLGSG